MRTDGGRGKTILEEGSESPVAVQWGCTVWYHSSEFITRIVLWTMLTYFWIASQASSEFYACCHLIPQTQQCYSKLTT